MHNRIELIGNLGKDPEIKTFDNGDKTASFSLATSFSYKTKEGEKKTITTWHNIQVKSGLVSVAEKYLKKGDKVFIEGMQLHKEYADTDGVKKVFSYVAVSSLIMLNSKPGGEQNQSETPKITGEDDLPF